MEFKLARSSINDSDCEIITLEDIEKKVEESKNRGVMLYFDQTNEEKKLKKILSHFNNRTTFLRNVKYGLSDKDFIYELHII